jgi:hypothetical protein
MHLIFRVTELQSTGFTRAGELMVIQRLSTEGFERWGFELNELRLEKDKFDVLRKVALKFMEVLPNLLRTLSDKYLETYHGAKVASFTQGQKFDEYFPLPPEDQKLIDSVQCAKEIHS